MFKKIAFVLSAVILFVSCEKIKDLTKFDIEYNQEVTIPSTTGISLPFDIFTPEVETNSESQFAINDTRKDLIEEITIKELELVIKSPDNADWSFLNSIEVFISAEDLEEVRIANIAEVSEDVGNTIVLDVSDEDLKEYIKKEEFSLRLKTVTDEAISQDHTIDVNSIFSVDAKILGL